MIVSSLDAIWTLEASTDLSDDERADAIAQLKASEWSMLTAPLTVGGIQIDDISVHGATVEFQGSGGTLDWPLRLINAPIGVLDPNGTDTDSDGRVWRVDCLAVLTDILGRFQ